MSILLSVVIYILVSLNGINSFQARSYFFPLKTTSPLMRASIIGPNEVVCMFIVTNNNNYYYLHTI